MNIPQQYLFDRPVKKAPLEEAIIEARKVRPRSEEGIRKVAEKFNIRYEKIIKVGDIGFGVKAKEKDLPLSKEYSELYVAEVLDLICELNNINPSVLFATGFRNRATSKARYYVYKLAFEQGMKNKVIAKTFNYTEATISVGKTRLDKLIDEGENEACSVWARISHLQIIK